MPGTPLQEATAEHAPTSGGATELVTISVKVDSAVAVAVAVAAAAAVVAAAVEVGVPPPAAVVAAAGMEPEAIWCALDRHPAHPSPRRGRQPRSLGLR